MKYTICTKDKFVCNSDNTRMLFNSIKDAEEFKSKHREQLNNASIHGYMNEGEMIAINGWKAWDLFKNGVSVYTKIWGLNWSLCTKEKWSFDDFTCGHFNFYIENI